MKSKNKIVTWLLSIVTIAALTLSWTQPVVAVIQQQQEAPGQLLYSSRHRLRDSQDNTWQVVLFKRVNENRVPEFNLRLVGFPDTAEFTHPGDLTVEISGEQSFKGSDRFGEQSPSSNVGEFEVAEIIPNLPLDRSVQLVLPISSSISTRISLPSPVILEWQELAKS